MWCLLDKKGNSSVDERAELFNEFVSRFGNRRLTCLTADREFVGGWVAYLLGEPNTPFRLRSRANHKLEDGRLQNRTYFGTPFSLKFGRCFSRKSAIDSHPESAP